MIKEYYSPAEITLEDDQVTMVTTVMRLNANDDLPVKRAGTLGQTQLHIGNKRNK